MTIKEEKGCRTGGLEESWINREDEKDCWRTGGEVGD